jgi:ADP-ribosylglycohydrolase
MPTLHERALGAYLGFAAGDALGATVEFMTRREIETAYRRHETIVAGGSQRLATGQATVDTEMAMCAGRAILEARAWDVARVCEQFATWLRGKPVDVGIRRYMADGQRRADAQSACSSRIGACPSRMWSIPFKPCCTISFATDSFVSRVVETVNHGGDADTTRALAGIAGGRGLRGAGHPAAMAVPPRPGVSAEIRCQVAARLKPASHLWR